MIICYDKTGQLCNRLWSFVPVIAHCMEQRCKLVILFFDEYAQYFPNINNGSFNNIKFKTFVKNKFASRCTSQFVSLLIKLLGLSYVGSLTEIKRKTAFINAWEHSKEDFNGSYYEQIVKLFEPQKTIIDDVDILLSRKKAEYDCVIGIHIRRGDYRSFMNGIYYYENSTYLNLMLKLQEKLQLCEKRVTFLLCSDEIINLNDFEGTNNFIIPNNEIMKDLYGLSKCDYIMGPPSTFSQWASFVGKVPLKLIHDKNETINLSSFELKETFGRGQM